MGTGLKPPLLRGGGSFLLSSYTKRRNDRLSNPVMAGLVPAITTRMELAKGAIPVSKHPTEKAGTSPAMTGFAARAVRQQQGRLVLHIWKKTTYAVATWLWRPSSRYLRQAAEAGKHTCPLVLAADDVGLAHPRPADPQLHRRQRGSDPGLRAKRPVASRIVESERVDLPIPVLITGVRATRGDKLEQLCPHALLDQSALSIRAVEVVLHAALIDGGTPGWDCTAGKKQ